MLELRQLKIQLDKQLLVEDVNWQQFEYFGGIRERRASWLFL